MQRMFAEMPSFDKVPGKYTLVCCSAEIHESTCKTSSFTRNKKSLSSLDLLFRTY